MEYGIFKALAIIDEERRKASSNNSPEDVNERPTEDTEAELTADQEARVLITLAQTLDKNLY